MTEACSDLCKYYDYVLSKMDEADAHEIIQHAEFEEDYFEEDDGELSTRLATKSDSVH